MPAGNVGNAPLKVTSAVFSNTFYSLKDSLSDIEPNGYRSVGIAYIPTSVTTDSVSTLTLTYSDGAAVKQTVITLKAQSIISSVLRSVLPGTFQLAQNFPNPFNPSTMISYQLPAASHIALKVFDMLGNEVATLVNETKEAGSYSATFDGSKLSSGIYFYTLQAGNFTATKKLSLIK